MCKASKNNHSPETAPANPVLTDVLHAGGLCKKLVHLVANIQLIFLSEISTSQLFLDSGKDLEGASILCLAGLSSAVWDVKNAGV